MTSFEPLHPAMPEAYLSVNKFLTSFLPFLLKLGLAELSLTEERVLIINVLNKFLMIGLN